MSEGMQMTGLAAGCKRRATEGAVSSRSSGVSSSRAAKSKSASCSDDFECAVCFELLLDPVVAPCGHDLCLHCYQRWTATSPAASAVCPQCRYPLPTNLAVCLRLKDTIERLCHADLKRRRIEQNAEPNHHLTATQRVPLSPTSPHPVPPSTPMPADPFDLVTAWAAAQQTLMTAMMLAMYAMSKPQHPSNSTQTLVEPAINPVDPISTAPTMCCSSESCSIAPSVDASSGSEVSSDAANAVQPATQRRHWQCGADSTARLAVARSILHVLQARGLHSSLGARLPDTVRLLELMLYRLAPSKAAYLEPSDLEQRIATTVRQHTRAARARRMHLSSPSQPSAPVGGAVENPGQFS